MQLHYPLNPVTGVEDQGQLPWSNGIPESSVEGSFPPCLAVVEPMQELVNLIAATGLTPASADLNQVIRAVRSGQLDFDATDISTTGDQVTCQISLPHSQIMAGLPFAFIKGANGNTGNAVPTLTITDLNGNNPVTGTIVKAGGGALAKGDLPGGSLIVVRAIAPNKFALVSLVTFSDVVQAVAATTRINAPGAIKIYVRTDGSDQNLGGQTNSAASAFATMQGAYNYLTKSYNPGFTASIILGIPGTYAGFTATNSGIAGTINVQGGDAANAPGSYIVTPVALGDGTYSSVVVSIQTVNLIGVTLDGSAIASGTVVNLHRVTPGGSTTSNNVIYRISGTNTSANPIYIDAGGSFAFAGPATFSLGTVGNVIQSNGNFQGGPVAGATLTINNAVFNNFLGVGGGTVNLQNLTFSATGNTGSRYNVSAGYVNPAAVALTAIPGNSPGTVTLGAGYVIGDPGVPWTPYNPGVGSTGGTIGTTSYVARYQRFGKLVTVFVQITILATGSGTGGVAFSLPVAPLNNVIGAGVEIGNTNKALSVRTNGVAMAAYFYDGSSPIAANNTLSMFMTYEAAN